MTKAITIILALLYSTISFSQTISVSSFRLLDSDLTANTTGTIEKDQNGEVSALIKVVTTQTGFTFDCGSMGIVKTLQKPSEIWVYVPRGIKKMTISHPQLGLLRDYYFNIPIESARTYELVLITGEVQTLVKESARSQYLVIKVNPSNAVVELDNEILPTSNGIAQKFLKFGTYEYRVQAQNYHPSAGKVTIDNPKEKKILSIDLQPAFGWLDIKNTSELEGALVYIDNSFVGSVPLKSDNLASGTHNIKVAKPLYLAYEGTIEIHDNETTTIAPNLEPDFSVVTLNVDSDADIYINEEHKGKGTWTGKLGSGTYLFEAKKENHRTTTINRDISSSVKEQVIQLEAPIPIYGELNITSTPTMSDVIIDGKEYGQTPLYIPEFLIGHHNYIIKHEGYRDYSGQFELNDNKKVTVNAELNINKTVSMNIQCSTKEASLYIDGEYKGEVGQTVELAIGSHRIVVKPYRANNDLINYDKIVTITGNDKELFINLDKYVGVSFHCDLSNPFFIIDGNLVDKDEHGLIKLTPGKHEVVVRHVGLDELRKDLDIDFSNKDFFISFMDRDIIPQSIAKEKGYVDKSNQYDNKKTGYNFVNVSFSCDQPRPFYIIDGNLMDRNSNGVYKLREGSHEIVVRHEGYNELRKTIIVNNSNKKFNVSFRNRDVMPRQ